MEDEALMQRMASFRIHQSIVQKSLKISEYWPLPSDKKVTRDTLFMSKEMLKKIKAAHKIK